MISYLRDPQLIQLSPFSLSAQANPEQYIRSESAAPGSEHSPRMAEAAAAALQKVVQAALGIGQKVLDSVSEDHYENEAMYCVWNDWDSRDKWARIHRTYKNGRMSRVKKVSRSDICCKIGN